MLILGGHFDEAEKLSRETREAQLRVLGPEHPDTAASTYNLASIAAHGGRPDQALSSLRDAIDHGLRPNETLQMAKDLRLGPLREDPRFEELIAYGRQRAAATVSPHYK